MKHTCSKLNIMCYSFWNLFLLRTSCTCSLLPCSVVTVGRHVVTMGRHVVTMG